MGSNPTGGKYDFLAFNTGHMSEKRKRIYMFGNMTNSPSIYESYVRIPFLIDVPLFGWIDASSRGAPRHVTSRHVTRLFVDVAIPYRALFIRV